MDRALNNWVDAGVQAPAGGPSRRVIADRLIQCWRNGLDRGLEPAFELNLSGADALPEWDADFTHVRSVRLTSNQLIGDSGTALLRRFAKIKKLEISVRGQDMAALAEKLPGLTAITELALESPLPTAAPPLVRALEGMTQLEQLALTGNMGAMDFSTLTNLRSLRLAGDLTEWPNGVFGLSRLETLELRRWIRSLPDELFSGNESLWRRMHLNWAALEPQAFKKAYGYVHDNPAHLLNEPRRVARYCRGRLSELAPNDDTFASDAMAQFSKDGLSGRALLDQVEALHQQQLALSQSLDAWKDRVVRVDGRQMEVQDGALIAEKIPRMLSQGATCPVCAPPSLWQARRGGKVTRCLKGWT